MTVLSIDDATERTEARPVALPRLAGHRGASWLLTLAGLGSLVGTGLVWALTSDLSSSGPVAFGFAVITAATAFFLLMMRGHFRVTMTTDATSRVAPVTASVALGGCLAIVVVAALPVEQPSFGHMTSLFALLITAGLGSHMMSFALLRRAWLSGRLRSRAVVYGCDELARELAIEIRVRRDYGIDVVGFIAQEPGEVVVTGGSVFTPDVDILDVLERTGADRLIIPPDTSLNDRSAIRAARRAASTGVPVYVVPRFFEMGLGMDALAPDRFRGYPIVRLQRSVHPWLGVRLKRAFDIAVSGALLAAFAPIGLLVGILIKLGSPGPVLFVQERVGQHGKPIRIRKFRSMRPSSASDHEWTADDRVTTIGRWIRRLNIDEIPQLYSVLVGDMSLVGPRPERPAFVETFRQQVPDYDDRHRMPVGITGLAQIVGLRGDTSIAERVKYDNLYVDQWSFRTDLRILIKTAAAVLRQSLRANQANELAQALSASEADVSQPSQSREGVDIRAANASSDLAGALRYQSIPSISAFSAEVAHD